MNKFQFILIGCALIVIATITVSSVFYPISKSSVPKQSESQELLYARDKLLLESAKILREVHRRLERMEQDLREIREKLTEENI